MNKLTNASHMHCLYDLHSLLLWKNKVPGIPLVSYDCLSGQGLFTGERI